MQSALACEGVHAQVDFNALRKSFNKNMKDCAGASGSCSRLVKYTLKMIFMNLNTHFFFLWYVRVARKTWENN